MPYKNEHACRLEDPEKFDKFNRVNCEQKHDGKCIDVIYGIKAGKSKIQALRYPTGDWTADAAKSHCKEREGTFEAAAEEATEVYECECVDCGHIVKTEEHCADIKCPECGGQMRRKERPGPGQKSETPDMERRIFDMSEIRVVNEDGKPPKLEGYSAVFNSESLNLGFFTEKIAPGAFKNAIKKSDTRALFNHNPDIVLGRKSAKTLRLKEDDKGLFMEVDPPDTQLVRDMVLTPIDRGDITQQSFGFTVKTEQWDEDKETGKVTRTLVEIEELYDVSPVTFPAYPDTSVALRSMAQWQKDHKDGDGQDRTELLPVDDEIIAGWEDITPADAEATRKEGEQLIQELRFKEVSEL